MTEEYNGRLKIQYRFRLQRGRCAITGEFLDQHKVYNVWYAQLHHAVEKSKVNERAYPLFLHCVWNLHLVKSDAHMNLPTPKGIPDRVALLVEAHLQSNRDIASLVNMEEEREVDVDEVDRLFHELLEEFWPERVAV